MEDVLDGDWKRLDRLDVPHTTLSVLVPHSYEHYSSESNGQRSSEWLLTGDWSGNGWVTVPGWCDGLQMGDRSG